MFNLKADTVRNYYLFLEQAESCLNITTDTLIANSMRITSTKLKTIQL